MKTRPFAADPLSRSVTSRRFRIQGPLLACLVLLFAGTRAHAQQFNSDNQWTAPHGVATVVATAGEEYSTVLLVGALLPDWEFNIGVTSYYGDLEGQTEEHATETLYAKYRLFENPQQTGGMAIMAGTGVNPSHIEGGATTDTFDSWWANLVYTIPFLDGRVGWDLMPGVAFNQSRETKENETWGMTYSSRVAVYDIVPQSAVVAEVFGTTGEAYAKPSYRFGVRWESKKLIIAATYSNTFDGSGGAGFEIGLMYLTEPRFCFGGCRN